VKVLAVALGLAYPLLVYAGLSYFEPRSLALALGLAVAVRIAMAARGREGVDVRRLLLAPVAVGGVLALAPLSNEARVFLFVPALVNLALLASFAHTLRQGPSMIETYARLQVDDLSAAEREYAVGVTRAWCVFFLANGCVCLWLAIRASVAGWALYTGLLSYVLMALLFAAELLYRTWRFRRYHGGFLNPLLERMFPPRDVAAGGD